MGKGKSGSNWDKITDEKKEEYALSRSAKTKKIVMNRLVPGMVQVVNQIGPKKWFESLTNTQQYNLIMRAMELQANAPITAAGDSPHVLQQVGHFSATLVDSERKQMEQFDQVDPPIVGTSGYNPARAAKLDTGDTEILDHQLPKTEYDQVEPMTESEELKQRVEDERRKIESEMDPPAKDGTNSSQ